MRTRKKRFHWSTLIGLAVSIPLLWWALHDIDLGTLLGEFKRAKPLPLALTAIFAFAAFPLQTVRWRYLLRLDGEKLPYRPLWYATAVGLMGNNVLPARAGEVARAYVARRLTSVRFSTAFTTILVSRVLDGLTLFTLLALAIVIGGFSASTEVGGVGLGKLMLAAALVFAVVIGAGGVAAHFPSQTVRLTRKVLGMFLPAQWVENVIQVAHGIHEGLDVIRSWSRIGHVVFWSLVIWGVNGLSFWFCSMAFDLNLPLHGAYVVQSLLNFGLIIPSTPGFVGVFEAVTRASLALFGVSPEAAISYALAYHVLNYVPITLVGFWTLHRTHLHLVEIQEQVDAEVDSGFQDEIEGVPEVAEATS